MIRVLARSIAGLLLVALLLYPVDWLVWRLRVANGNGTGRAVVREVTVATLKGNKSEYYIDGSVEVECSRSLFPQSGAGACWWLRRHNQIVREQ